MDNVLKKLLETIDLVEREQRKLINEEEFCKSVTLDNGLVIKLESDYGRAENVAYGYYLVNDKIYDAILSILSLECYDELTDTVFNTDIPIEERIKKIKNFK